MLAAPVPEASPAMLRFFATFPAPGTLAELKGVAVRTVYLEVRESNRAARTLYDADGFEPVGRRRRYYRSPVEDALVLKREIGPT